MESNFVFEPVVSLAIYVVTFDRVGSMIEVRLRVYQVLLRDVLWGSNPATLRIRSIY
jgi:hypothetical protein